MIGEDLFEKARCREAYDWDQVERPFFEHYENEESGDHELRHMVDQMCLACPVRRECFGLGRVTKSTGVFGGWFMKEGKIVESKNAHKPAHVREAMSH